MVFWFIPLQFLKYEKIPLLFTYFEACHYNSLPQEYHRIRMWTGWVYSRMDSNTLVSLSLTQGPHMLASSSSLSSDVTPAAAGWGDGRARHPHKRRRACCTSALTTDYRARPWPGGIRAVVGLGHQRGQFKRCWAALIASHGRFVPASTPQPHSPPAPASSVFTPLPAVHSRRRLRR